MFLDYICYGTTICLTQSDQCYLISPLFCTFKLEKREKGKKTNRILVAVNNFIIDLFEDPEFKLYDVKGKILKQCMWCNDKCLPRFQMITGHKKTRTFTPEK